MTAPFVVTSRLGNILQVISLAHQTGILRVIRGQGATREMGQIRFIDGEPVSALLGQLTGETALGVLNNWGECYYAFDELSAADVSGGLSPFPSTGAGQGAGAYYYSGRSADSAGGPSGTDAYDLGGPLNAQFFSEYGSLPSQPTPTSPLSDLPWPVYSYQQSGLFSASGGQPSAQGPLSPPSIATPEYVSPSSVHATPGTQTQGHAVSTSLLTAVPRRTLLAEQIEHLPLDRRERMVLLLVDGQRTVADLARLTRRSEVEVQAVLTHLELLRLIVVGG